MSTVVAFTPVRSRQPHQARQPQPAQPSGSPHVSHRVSSRVSSSSSSGPAPLRLTPRGRLVAAAAAAVLLIVALAAGVLLIGHQALAGETAAPVPATYRVVLPGETLWSIAGEVAPGADRRDTIDRIVEFNALNSPGVQAGQRVAIPGDVTQH